MTLPFVSRATLQSATAERDAQASRAQQLQDQLRRCEAERDMLREQAAASAAEAREALRMVADWLAEHQFGTKIFGVGPALPAELPLMAELERYNTVQGSRRARDLVRAGQEKFLQDLRGRSAPPTAADFEALMPKEIGAVGTAK